MNHLKTCVRKLGQIGPYEPSDVEDQLKRQEVEREDLRKVIGRAYYRLGLVVDGMHNESLSEQDALLGLLDILENILAPHL